MNENIEKELVENNSVEENDSVKKEEKKALIKKMTDSLLGLFKDETKKANSLVESSGGSIDVINNRTADIDGKIEKVKIETQEKISEVQNKNQEGEIKTMSEQIKILDFIKQNPNNPKIESLMKKIKELELNEKSQNRKENIDNEGDIEKDVRMLMRDIKFEFFSLPGETKIPYSQMLSFKFTIAPEGDGFSYSQILNLDKTIDDIKKRIEKIKSEKNLEETKL